MLNVLDQLQLLSGRGTALLEAPEPLPTRRPNKRYNIHYWYHLGTGWFVTMRYFLHYIHGSILIPGAWKPTLHLYLQSLQPMQNLNFLPITMDRCDEVSNTRFFVKDGIQPQHLPTSSVRPRTPRGCWTNPWLCKARGRQRHSLRYPYSMELGPGKSNAQCTRPAPTSVRKRYSSTRSTRASAHQETHKAIQHPLLVSPGTRVVCHNAGFLTLYSRLNPNPRCMETKTNPSKRRCNNGCYLRRSLPDSKATSDGELSTHLATSNHLIRHRRHRRTLHHTMGAERNQETGIIIEMATKITA